MFCISPVAADAREHAEFNRMSKLVVYDHWLYTLVNTFFTVLMFPIIVCQQAGRSVFNRKRVHLMFCISPVAADVREHAEHHRMSKQVVYDY